MFSAFHFHLLAALLLTSHAHAQYQAPALAGQGSAISSRDRIYTGDQTSNTVTVIDPGTSSVLGTIAFGSSRLSNNLNPQNVDSMNSHGLGFSRDGKYIVSLSTLSNTATVIRTADNTIITRAYVDRGPHEAFFAPDNRTIWIGTRGVSSVNIIDGMNGTLLDKIATGRGPSKVLFSPNGTIAYVNHIFEPVISVIDVSIREVSYNITGLADAFSSDMMISADGGSLWAAHKMSGQVSVIDLAARKVAAVLDSGPETNHPNFAIVNGTTYAFVTVAAINATRVYSQPSPAEIPVFVKNIPASGVQPHGLWPSADNTRMYVVNEHSDTMDIIDTNSLEVIKTIRIGQEGQALIYVSNAVPEGMNGTENLGKQGLGLRVESYRFPVFGNASNDETDFMTDVPKPQAQITIRKTSGLDMFQVIGRNLVLNGTYTVSARRQSSDENSRTPLMTFTANTRTRTGCGTAPQALAFFKFWDVYDVQSLEVRQGA
ncbi:uncharacterized protein RCC_00188 [Ramularia collo-cygni]|uniref:YVTN beta-propeller repeat-containing protein n=1 Tax=Ramularia collo-cygni TaxID=112498 RepID=A0A2D3UW07_9PEZI|nr:uncharacterized protein RCC_00188 [Ramularia collo-cygni]CZT14214.1 uncharacterized protein RCC_00188 [Ramularia collo-cygni]